MVQILKGSLRLTLDGYEGNPEQMGNIDTVYEFLKSCSGKIGMAAKMEKPYAFKYHNLKVPENWGVSGFVLLKDPGVHISIHTFPDRGYVSLDIFSTKGFDHIPALEYVTEVFGLKRSEFNLLDKGQEFPREISEVVRQMKEAREKMRK